MRKRNVFIVVFLAAILLSTPFSAAFQMPLTKKDKKELEESIKKINNEEIENNLSGLISDTHLNIDRVEEEMEKYVTNGFNPVMETPTWQWIKDRLGWVYFTMENITAVYNSGAYLAGQFSYKYSVITGWFKSIKKLKENWEQFKTEPTLPNIINLVNSARNAAMLTTAIIEDILDGEQELIQGLEDLKTDLNQFSEFLQEEPWMKPILIYGKVTGLEEEAVVSCHGDSVNTTRFFNLSYVTADQEKPWWVHKCVTTLNYDDKEKSEEAYAFSMGKIEVNFDVSTDKQVIYKIILRGIMEFLMNLGIGKNLIEIIQLLL